jgi:hypothetical protein
MAMNKKEQAAFDDLQAQLRIAKALRFTEPVKTDVPIPESFRDSSLAKGWLYNAYVSGNPRVEKSCSSSVHHSFGNDDKTTTQGACRLYSTKLRALRAMRHEVEQRVAKILADIDAEIEAEVAPDGTRSVRAVG